MVNIYEPELTSLEQELLNYLFLHPEKAFNLHTLSKKLRKSQPGITKAIRKLHEKGYVTLSKDKDSGRWSAALNRESSFVTSMKRAENLRNIYRSGLAERLFEEFPGATILLFGSYSKGEDTSESDVDIAIVGSERKDLDLAAFEEALERDVNINFYTDTKDLDRHFRNNLLNGIVLSGSVET